MSAAFVKPEDHLDDNLDTFAALQGLAEEQEDEPAHIKKADEQLTDAALDEMLPNATTTTATTERQTSGIVSRTNATRQRKVSGRISATRRKSRLESKELSGVNQVTFQRALLINEKSSKFAFNRRLVFHSIFLLLPHFFSSFVLSTIVPATCFAVFNLCWIAANMFYMWKMADRVEKKNHEYGVDVKGAFDLKTAPLAYRSRETWVKPPKMFNFMARYFGVANSDIGRAMFPSLIVTLVLTNIMFLLSGVHWNDGVVVAECGGYELLVAHLRCNDLAQGAFHTPSGTTVQFTRIYPYLWPLSLAGYQDELSAFYTFSFLTPCVFTLAYPVVAITFAWWPKPEVKLNIQRELEDLGNASKKVGKEYAEQSLYVAERVTSKQAVRVRMCCLQMSHWEFGTFILATLAFFSIQIFTFAIFYDYEVITEPGWLLLFSIPGATVYALMCVALSSAMHPAFLSYYIVNLKVLLLEHCKFLDFRRPRDVVFWQAYRKMLLDYDIPLITEQVEYAIAIAVGGMVVCTFVFGYWLIQQRGNSEVFKGLGAINLLILSIMLMSVSLKLFSSSVDMFLRQKKHVAMLRSKTLSFHVSGDEDDLAEEELDDEEDEAEDDDQDAAMPLIKPSKEESKKRQKQIDWKTTAVDAEDPEEGVVNIGRSLRLINALVRYINKHDRSPTLFGIPTTPATLLAFKGYIASFVGVVVATQVS